MLSVQNILMILIQILIVICPGVCSALIFYRLLAKKPDIKSFAISCARFSLVVFIFLEMLLFVKGEKDFSWQFISPLMAAKLFAIALIPAITAPFAAFICIKHVLPLLKKKKKPGKKTVIRLIVICLVTGAVAFGAAFLMRQIRMKEIKAVREVIDREGYIIHACGSLTDEKTGKEYDYINNMDALKNAYDNGHRVFEVDFLFSLDGELLCSHEWEHLYLNDELLTDTPVTKDEFLKLKRYNVFSTMWFGDLVDYMKEHEDMYVITDISGGNEEGAAYIARFCPELMDRFIVQIYHEYEYDPIRKLGFKNVIYTLFGTGESERTPEKLMSASRKHDLVGYTFWYYWADDPEFLASLKRTKIPLYVHTVTDEQLEKKYFDMGISAIYTDNAEKGHVKP